MATSRLNYVTPFTRSVISGEASAGIEPFVLVDVGASGGIGSYWRVFEPRLRAHGFDPLVKECERLNREERNPGVVYHAAYIVGKTGDCPISAHAGGRPQESWTNQSYERTSAVRATRAMSMNFVELHNSGQEIVLADEKLSLDEFFRSRSENVDFIKVDTDGHDLEVLHGAKSTLASHPVLGLLIEAPFHGELSAQANIFANIDSLLRNQGFSLFDLEVYRYARAALPGRFSGPLPGPTCEGQVVWADVLYLRDVASPGYRNQWNAPVSSEKVIKLACLFELFGMPDCAAELLLSEREGLGDRVDVPRALDMLAQEMDPAYRGFDDLNRAFERAPELFYPRSGTNRLRRALSPTLRGQLSRLKRRLAEFLIRA